MSEIVKEPAEKRPRRVLIDYLFSIVGVVVLTICLFSPARDVADVQLDSSNYSSYSYFTAKDFQFGTEVMPMAGPYGFVPYGFTYSGHLFGKRFFLELITKVILSALVVWFFHRARNAPIMRWLWLILLFVMIPLIDDLPYALAILLSGLCLIECHVADDRPSLITACALAVYLALLTLFKGTQTTLAIATLGLLALQAILTRNFRRLPWIVCSYIAALIVLLVVAGQNPLNLPRYLHGMLELSTGYNLAVGLEEPRLTFLTGVGSLIALELLILAALLPRWRNPAAVAGGLLLGGFTFIEWKHGFVRADGHVFIFYNYALSAALTIPLFITYTDASRSPLWSRILVIGLTIGALSLSLWSDGNQVIGRHEWSLTRLPGRIKANLQQFVHPLNEKARLETLLANQRNFYQLPRIQETVGTKSIDFFGVELGYLMLNKLNYRPRPVGGGSFSVLTPWLQDLNTTRLADPAKRPNYYLVNPQTIDDHLLTQDDPGTLRSLLAFYNPIASELGLVLFESQPNKPSVLPEARLLRTERVALGVPVNPPVVGPNEMLLVEFDLPLTLWGRARSSLYKPPMVFMDLKGDGITNPLNRRIVPNLFQNPVPLSPVLEDSRDLLSLYSKNEGKIVRQFTLHSTQPELFAKKMLRVRFYSTTRPNAQPEQSARLIDSLGLPITIVPPLSIESPNSPLRQFGALPVQMLEPPGCIRFALTGEEREISFIYGIDPQAYLEGETDGAGFSVEIERPNQAPQQIFHALLEPMTKTADRGSHTASVFLPLYPRGTTISLKTDRGPTGNGSWDWTYFGGIRLHVRDYSPDQFPGFSRLPVNVDAANGGVMPHQDRRLFMLNSPGALIFSLKPTDKRLSFTAGLIPEAYSGTGHSDGVQFTVDLRTPDGNLTRLFQVMNNPRDVPADRGDQTYSVDLPEYVAPNAQLILSALPGPADSTAWDWSYIANLHFDQE